MNTKIIRIAIVATAVASTLAIAADDKDKKANAEAAKKTTPAKPAATAGKPADKGAQGGIILQNQGAKTDKGAQGGIILQNQGGKTDKGAQGGIILQNQGAKGTQKAPAAASKTATQKAATGTQ